MNQGTQIVCCRWGRFATQQQAWTLRIWTWLHVPASSESGPFSCSMRPVYGAVVVSFSHRKKQRAKPIRVRSVNDRNQSSTIIFKLLINICICSQYRPGSTGALSMDCQNRQLSCRGNPCRIATKVVDDKIIVVL